MPITIAVDAMGSDRAPKPEVEGAIQAARHYNVRVLLVGQDKVVLPEMIVLAGAGMEAFWLSRPRWQRIFFLPAGFVKLTDGRRGQQVPAINCR